jgi:catabolite repression HPr-like protein
MVQVSNIKIRLVTIQDVADFVSCVSNYPHDVTLSSSKYIVNGKSNMGIFSLDLSKPIEMMFQGTREQVDGLLLKVEAFKDIAA